MPIDAFMLTSVGELNINKNHSVVIRALSKTKKSVHYLVVGKGELEEPLKTLAEECGVMDRVHLLGFRTDISDLYRASDVCVFPSIREGLGLAGVEGMSCGLLLIVADNRGTRSYVGTDNGILCQYNDVHGFAKTISELLANELRCAEIKTFNLKRSRNFDIEVVNKEMKFIYGEILNAATVD